MSAAKGGGKGQQHPGQRPGKERPQMDGTAPELSGKEPPEGFGGQPSPAGSTEVSTDFVLTAEGGTFGNISAAE